MNTDPTNDRGRRVRPLARAGGLLAAGAVAGGILAATISASAADDATGTTTGTVRYGYARSDAADRGSAPVRDDERPVSADVAAKLRAAALKAVPGGTVHRVETDAGDAAYEAHMARADGTSVTVTFDSGLAVTGVEDGMGRGDPHRGPGADDDTADDGTGTAG